MTFIDFSINCTFTLRFRESGLVCRFGCEIPEDHSAVPLQRVSIIYLLTVLEILTRTYVCKYAHAHTPNRTWGQ